MNWHFWLTRQIDFSRDVEKPAPSWHVLMCVAVCVVCSGLVLTGVSWRQIGAATAGLTAAEASATERMRRDRLAQEVEVKARERSEVPKGRAALAAIQVDWLHASLVLANGVRPPMYLTRVAWAAEQNIWFIEGTTHDPAAITRSLRALSAVRGVRSLQLDAQEQVSATEWRFVMKVSL
ncbi:hypothetical protein EYS42_12250 [Aquabacterium lacunae]|uniref:Fimbrial assembly protein n=1 Tax=Aquabacterium lacunae TaxID=2528630 RepID=A0A4Q9H1V4_9BURK|nr:hypothetical protein [Aquabacterium lacunae]TBO30449.1 hypothetical protein EYS42_12250 [Aquabacterium lacunae]